MHQAMNRLCLWYNNACYYHVMYNKICKTIWVFNSSFDSNLLLKFIVKTEVALSEQKKLTCIKLWIGYVSGIITRVITMLCIIRFARLSGYSIHLLIQNWLSKFIVKTEIVSPAK